jgi:L,D-transpeptidase catalytic domain
MKQRALKASAAIFAIATVGVASAGCGGSEDSAIRAATVARQALAPKRSGPTPSLARQPRQGPYFPIVQLRRSARLPLFATPGGKVVQELSAKTEFGSPRVLGVVRQRGSWLGVSTSLRPDGRLGWVRFDVAKMKLYWTRYSLRVLLYKRELQLRYGRRLMASYTVTVGAAGSSTPLGRFAITDALVFQQSPYYGCCALALSGRQEHLPVGWLGGDRIAIHGTPGPVGFAASHGCIRATDETMRALFRRVPLGTPVFVRS